jgi:hypothetical protein
MNSVIKLTIFSEGYKLRITSHFFPTQHSFLSLPVKLYFPLFQNISLHDYTFAFPHKSPREIYSSFTLSLDEEINKGMCWPCNGEIPSLNLCVPRVGIEICSHLLSPALYRIWKHILDDVLQAKRVYYSSLFCN